LIVCAANVRVQSSSVAFTVQIPQKYELTGLLTKQPWMDLETSRPHNSSSSTVHKAARFRHCCIQLSMKRWCQLNRARVAHDARPALSSYQNKCSNPTVLICLHYDSTDCHGIVIWNLWSGRRQPIRDRVWQYLARVGPTAVYVCYNVD